jgi:flagellar hook-associated protein 3 FlgL
MPIPIHFRTTQNIIVNSTVNSLHRNAGRVQRLQFQQATGKRINTPSDDPLGARRALKFQNEDRRFQQFKRNLENTASSLNETTVVLNEVVDQLMKAHDIAIRANNDVLNAEQRGEIANEIDQMLEAVFRISNTNREGEFIFSGTDKDTQTFEAIRDENGEIIGIEFRGNNVERKINIGLGEQVAKNIGGGITFQNPGGDVFKSLLNLRDNLRNGESLMMDIGDIRKALNFTLDQVTELNTRFQVLELARERLESSQIINRNLLSLTEDADLARLLVDLMNHQNILQASLAVGGRVIPPTLLQFI